MTIEHDLNQYINNPEMYYQNFQSRGFECHVSIKFKNSAFGIVNSFVLQSCNLLRMDE